MKTATAKKPAAKKTASKRRAPPESPAPPGLDRSAARSAATEMSWAHFDRLVQQLAKLAAKFDPDAIVGVAHGGVFVGGALASAMQREFYPVRISRRSRDRGLRGNPKLAGVMPKELKGRKVLIVDDIASSGDTLQLATAHAKSVGAKGVATLALVCRPDGFQPDFHALKEDTFYVFPWDYASVVEEPRFEM
jgi:hypoxanthine phosphoribosyltransferase